MADQKDYDNLNKATRKLAQLLAIKSTIGRDGKPIYVVDGQELTQYGYDKAVKKQREEIQKLRDVISPPAAQEEKQAALAGRARQQAEELTNSLLKLTRIRKDFEMAASRASTSQERERLSNWVRVYRDKETEFQNAVSQLASDVPLTALPQMPQMITPDQAKTMPIAGPQVSEVGQPSAPMQGGFAGAPVGQVTTPTAGSLTAVQRGEQGIQQGQGTPTPSEQPVTDTTKTSTTPAKTPATTTTPGVPAAPAPAGPGMTVTDPATGQPVTLPAGIDFGWLASQVPADWEKAAREMFGVWYDVFKNDPEMSKFIDDMMRGPELSDDMFKAKLQQTNWWRTTNATTRNWLQLETTDPASANQQIANTANALRSEALKRGLSVSESLLNEAALNINKFGFSSQMALEHLAQSTLAEAGGPSQLVRGYYGQNVKATAAQYGVPLSDITLNKWVADIATGRQSMDSFQSYVLDLSKNLYPALSSGLDRGLTFQQMTSPYAQVASNILEIPDAQVDFTDPKWAAAFTMKDAKGQQVQMSFGEWADYLRTNPAFGYEYTDGAQQKAYQVANQLARLFGAA